MPSELTPGLIVALIVIAAGRFVRRQRGFATTPLPDVADAPTSATPITSPRLNDNGLATYSLDIPESSEADRR